MPVPCNFLFFFLLQYEWPSFEHTAVTITCFWLMSIYWAGHLDILFFSITLNCTCHLIICLNKRWINQRGSFQNCFVSGSWNNLFFPLEATSRVFKMFAILLAQWAMELTAGALVMIKPRFAIFGLPIYSDTCVHEGSFILLLSPRCCLSYQFLVNVQLFSFFI